MFLPNEQDTILTSALKGGATGGLTALGLQGIADIIAFLEKKISKKPEKEQLYFELPKKKDEEEDEQLTKQSGQFVDLNKNMYGLSLVFGAYGAYQLLQALNKKEEQEKIKQKIKDMPALYKDELSPGQIAEMQKMSSDNELNAYLDGYLCSLEKEAGVWEGVKDFGSNVTQTLALTGEAALNLLKLLYTVGVTAPARYMPVINGMLAGIGTIGGWEIAKHMVSPYKTIADNVIPGSKLNWEFKRK